MAKPEAMTTEMSDKAYRKIINSWAMYDWANSACVTTIMAAMFPPFYRSLVIFAGLGEANATAFWAYTTSLMRGFKDLLSIRLTLGNGSRNSLCLAFR